MRYALTISAAEYTYFMEWQMKMVEITTGQTYMYTFITLMKGEIAITLYGFVFLQQILVNEKNK